MKILLTLPGYLSGILHAVWIIAGSTAGCPRHRAR